MNNLTYIPPESLEVPETSKFYVKFSNNIYLSKSFLKKHNIDHKDEDLTDTPLGKCYVITPTKDNKNEED